MKILNDNLKQVKLLDVSFGTVFLYKDTIYFKIKQIDVYISDLNIFTSCSPRKDYCDCINLFSNTREELDENYMVYPFVHAELNLHSGFNGSARFE